MLQTLSGTVQCFVARSAYWITMNPLTTRRKALKVVLRPLPLSTTNCEKVSPHYITRREESSELQEDLLPFYSNLITEAKENHTRSAQPSSSPAVNPLQQSRRDKRKQQTDSMVSFKTAALRAKVNYAGTGCKQARRNRDMENRAWRTESREPSISERDTVCHCHYATEVLRLLEKWHSQQNVILDAALSCTIRYIYVKIRDTKYLNYFNVNIDRRRFDTDQTDEKEMKYIRLYWDEISNEKILGQHSLQDYVAPTIEVSSRLVSSRCKCTRYVTHARQ
ncbi:hypothetical protein ALC57_15045 [Trachymyrmex cornetzi]|uniref:Uncharacterized protein n=1 Tax=Trachymyrmex cornetzi TaxID=471704 RepID=A0A195DIW9_9HYME|nr:hypothetical protein ALC57_15045 [Trachymyrmex cornetzi]